MSAKYHGGHHWWLSTRTARSIALDSRAHAVHFRNCASLINKYSLLQTRSNPRDRSVRRTALTCLFDFVPFPTPHIFAPTTYIRPPTLCWGIPHFKLSDRAERTRLSSRPPPFSDDYALITALFPCPPCCHSRSG